MQPIQVNIDIKLTFIKNHLKLIYNNFRPIFLFRKLKEFLVIEIFKYRFFFAEAIQKLTFQNKDN